MSEQKGDEYVRLAEKKLNSWSWSDKVSDAAELYEKAGNAYKVGKAWQKGGETFRTLADLHLKKKDSPHEAASALIEASNCFQKLNNKAGIPCLEQAIEIYTDMGRLSMVARYCKDLAERYEKEEDREKAIEWYEKAADFYHSENAQSSSNQMKLKVAEFSALEEDYKRAIQIYEEVGRDSLSSNLLKYGTKGHLMNAGICVLCLSDEVAIQKALERYSDLDPGFGDSREYKLLKSLSEAVEERDVDAFTEHLREYDSVSRLDSWKTTLLLRVKETIKDEDENLM